MSLTIKPDPKPKPAAKMRPDMPAADARMKPPPKIGGRRASQAERQRAQAIVDTYRWASGNDDNPGWLHVDTDPETFNEDAYCGSAIYLARALQHFANEGTFAHTFDVRPMLANQIGKRKALTYDEKVSAVMEMFNVSEGHAERWLKQSRKPPKG